MRKKVIVQHDVCAEYELRRLKLDLVFDKFSKQCWGDLIYFNDKSYLNILMQFYANLRKGDEKNHILSKVNGIDMSFDRKVVNHYSVINPRTHLSYQNFSLLVLGLL